MLCVRTLDVDVITRLGVGVEVEVADQPEQPVDAEPVGVETASVAEQEVERREAALLADPLDGVSQRADHVIGVEAGHQQVEEPLGIGVALGLAGRERHQLGGFENRPVVAEGAAAVAERVGVLELEIANRRAADVDHDQPRAAAGRLVEALRSVRRMRKPMDLGAAVSSVEDTAPTRVVLLRLAKNRVLRAQKLERDVDRVACGRCEEPAHALDSTYRST